MSRLDHLGLWFRAHGAIASDQPSRLAELGQGKGNVKYAVIDSLRSGTLSDLINQADVVIR